MSSDDRLRDLIGDLGSAPEPTAEQRNASREALHAAMAAESRPQRIWRRRPALGWATAVATAAVVTGVLVLPGSTPTVDANLVEIARAARAVPASQLPDGAFIYFQTEERIRNHNETAAGEMVRYWLTTLTDHWVSGTSQAERRTVLSPEFDTEADSIMYFASNLPESDRVGETTSQQFTDITEQVNIASLSTDPATLRKQILDELRQNPDFTEEDEAAIAGHVAQILSPRFNAPPDLRAALIEILGSLDVETTMMGIDGVRVTLVYREDGILDWQQDYELDSNGFLRRDRLILLGHATGIDVELGLKGDIRYSPPEVVPGKFVFPAG